MKISDLINLEANERLRRLRWSVSIRYLVLLVVLVLVFVGSALSADYDLIGVFAVGLFGLLFNAISSYLYHRARYPGSWPYVGIIIDMAIITLIVHFTGGIESIFLLLYVLQIVGTNVHFSRLAGPLNFVVGGVAFVGLIIFEGSGMIPHVSSLPILSGAFQDSNYILIVALPLITLMGISAYRSGYVVQSLEVVEHELAGLNDQLIQANQSLAVANRRLKEVDQMKTEFISVASHQLRTPLSAVKWVLKMVMDQDVGPVTAEQLELLKKGYQSNERMIALINDLLNVARIEEGRFEYRFSRSAIVSVLEAAAKELQSAIERKRITFTFEKSKTLLPTLRLDADKMRIAVENVLTNALKYTPEGGTVVLRVRASGASVVIEVQDNGVGIPIHQQDRVFGKFFRGDNVVRMQTEGTGLGLFITKNIVEAHRGQISFTSREGVGTTFMITLPITVEPAQKIPTKLYESFMKSF